MSLDLAAVLPDLSSGGAQRITINLMNGMVSRGRKVGVLIFNSDDLHIQLHDIDSPVWTARRSRLLTAILPLIGEIRRQRPRVVFSTLGYVNLGLLLLKPLLPASTKLWLREANLPSLSLQSNRFQSSFRAAYRVLYPFADRIICSSNLMRQEMEREFDIPASILSQLHNPVDVESVRAQAYPYSRIPGPGRRFVASGRLTNQKGFDRLLEMYASLREPGDRLVILGDGPLRYSLKQLAMNLGVAARVCFVGYVRNPWAFYAGADALLLPSRWEGVPNAALEALACGTPVIATPESGGMAEVAEVAAPGAVRVVAAGTSFVDAMRQVTARRIDKLSVSLLPSQYRLESVLDDFESWLSKIG